MELGSQDHIEVPDTSVAEGGADREQQLSAEELALAAGGTGNIGPEGQNPGGPPGPGGGLGGDGSIR